MNHYLQCDFHLIPDRRRIDVRHAYNGSGDRVDSDVSIVFVFHSFFCIKCLLSISTSPRPLCECTVSTLLPQQPVSDGWRRSRVFFSRITQQTPVYTCPVSWYSWITDKWQSCTVTCGGGVEQRSVYCVRQLDDGNFEAAVSDDLCVDTKPASSRPCSEQPCPAWFTGAWSPVRLCTPCTRGNSLQPVSRQNCVIRYVRGDLTSIRHVFNSHIHVENKLITKLVVGLYWLYACLIIVNVLNRNLDKGWSLRTLTKCLREHHNYLINSRL